MAESSFTAEFIQKMGAEDFKKISTFIFFPLSINSHQYGGYISVCSSKLKYAEEIKEDCLKMWSSLLLPAFSEMERKPNSPKSLDQAKGIVKPASDPSKELPDNIKKEIKQKCTSELPSDYAKQAECVKLQEDGWIKMNQT